MLVEMTIDLGRPVKAKMLPTPAKFHYIVNLRDLSRVFQGVFMCDVGEVLRSDVTLLGLWKHECERVFCDRLIDEADKGWFAKTVDKVLDDRYGGAKSAALKEPMHFVDFLRDGERPGDRRGAAAAAHLRAARRPPECRSASRCS